MSAYSGCDGCEGLIALGPAAEQPISSEIRLVDGLFIKSMAVRYAGTVVPQHSHKWDHVSALTLGAVRLWKDGVLDGDHEAPAMLTIKAGVKHTFMALRDETLILCIHRIDRTGEVDIAEEHHIMLERT